MGLGERLKDIYYLGEEKWYSFWDKVDGHLPVYKAIDPIDNLIPSFALFLVIIFLILLFIGAGLFSLVGAQNAVLKLTVVDSSGNPIEGANISLSWPGGSFDSQSGTLGVVDPVAVPFNSTVSVTATKGSKEKTTAVFIDSFEKIEQIILGGASFEGTRTLRFETDSGELATGRIDLTFLCSTNATAPENQTIYTGTTNVTYSEDDCGTLTVQASSAKYETDTFSLNSPSNVFTLREKGAGTRVLATVNLTYNGAPITEAVSVDAYLSGSYISADTKLSSNGQAVFNLPEGSYTFRTKQMLGYKAKESAAVELSASAGPATATIVMEKSYVGSINVSTMYGATALSDVTVVLSKNTAGNLVEVNREDSNASGKVSFDLTEDGPYIVTATKDGYCDDSKIVNVGDAIAFSMQRDNGQCGSKLMVKVVDQDGKPVTFAKVALFSQKGEDSYKLPYAEKLTDLNGYAEWTPVKNSAAGEEYKVFAYKATYYGWSDSSEFNVQTSAQGYTVTMQIPLGNARVKVTDTDGKPLQFAEVQLFDEYVPSDLITNPVSGRKLVEDVNGGITYSLKADKSVYAVVKKEGYETYTSQPKQLVGSGTVTFEIALRKPPVDQLQVNFLGMYKGAQKVLQVEADSEYDALFEVAAPKAYDELGFFVRMGKDDITKTELDKAFIESVIAPAKRFVVTGSTYNAPTGYNTDSQYLNLEESKWAQVAYQKGSTEVGKVIVGVKVKIRRTAQSGDRIDLGYRAWGVDGGTYERDLSDATLGASQSSSAKQELYAATKEAYISVGTETLCDSPTQERSFCVTSTYTDPDNFTNSFVDSFDAKNSTPYLVSIKVMNNSLVSFDNAQVMLTNDEQNLVFGNYSLITPTFKPVSGDLNTFGSGWIDAHGFVKNSSIDFVTIRVTPQKTGTGTIKLRIREGNQLIYEKPFTLNILASKKLAVKFMKGTDFSDTMPDLLSGEVQQLTVKALDDASGLEVEGALVKVYDRFGTLLLTKETNKLGTATITIPASFPGEKLTLQIEKPEYETLVKDFMIAQDVVSVNPTELNFTVNPQSQKEDAQTVRIDNKTGMDLTINSIELTGKLKGVLDEAQIESYFNNFKGTPIKSQDFSEVDFKVISATIVPSAQDIDGEFEVTVGALGKEWVVKIPAKIRVGLGKDVDLQSCLGISKTTWEDVTRGNQIQLGLEVVNNCTVDGKPVALKNLGATLNQGSALTGTFNAAYRTAQVELGTAYPRIFKPSVSAAEKIPLTISFTPSPGSSGTATGTITFEAQNQTDSTPQKITAELKYNINYDNVQDCLVLGSDLVNVSIPGDGSFSINNNCKFKTDIQLDKGDLQGAISESIFSLNAGESKDVKVSTSEGQIPGAYNILVLARQQGTTLEIVGNVKILAEDAQSCFKLTRYEYDVFDSPFNEFDGVDRGYLRNECVQKAVSASVSGIIPYDSSNLWRSMLVGGLIGAAGAYSKNGGKGGSQSDITETPKDKTAELEKKIKDLQDQLNAKQSSSTSKSNTSSPVENATPLDKAPQIPTTDNSVPSGQTIDDASAIKVTELTPTCSVKTVAAVEFIPGTVLDEAKTQAACKDVCTSRYVVKNKGDCDSQINSCTQSCITQVTDRRQLITQKLAQLNTYADNVGNEVTKSIQSSYPELSAAFNSLKVDASTGLASVEKVDIVSIEQYNTALAKLRLAYSVSAAEFNDNFDKIQKDLIKNGVLEVKDGASVIAKAVFYPPFEATAPAKTTLDVADGSVELSANPNASVRTTENEVRVKDELARIALSVAQPKTGVFTVSQSGETGTPINGLLVSSPGQQQTLIPNGQITVNDLSKLGFTQVPESAFSKYGQDPRSSSLYGNNLYLKTIAEGASAGTYYVIYNGGEIKGQGKVVDNKLVYSNGLPDLKYSVPSSGQFALITSGPVNSPVANSQNNAIYALLQGGLAYGAGSTANSTWGGALAGGAVSFLFQWLQAQDTPVNYSDTFAVPLVQISDIQLQSPEGIQLKVGPSTYDYDNFRGLSATSVQSSATVGQNSQSAYTGNVLYNPQALSATIGQIEQRELEFANPAKAVNRSRDEPFTGILDVTGTEKVYETNYNYDYVREKASARGDLKSSSSGGAFSFLTDFFKPPGVTEPTAEITDADLKVKETRNYEKKFHLLFDSYEYVDCGPNTYPCQTTQLSNCDVDGKKGLTGPEALPKIKLSWNWGSISPTSCDSDNNPNNYIYCDSTQFTIATLQKLMAIKSFLNTHNLANCPTAIDIVGTKTQKLSENALDVGITSVQVKPTAKGATISAIVETNNNLAMSAKVTFRFTRQDGSVVGNVCADKQSTFTSSAQFDCNIDSATAGTGYFNVDVSAQPTLCQGCENNDTTNDSIKTALTIGSAGNAQQCLEYATDRDYFEKVLSANNLLSQGGTVLGYMSFKANLVRDAFSADFKQDFDNYVNQVAGAPVDYRSSGVRDLFLSDKFVVKWPTKPIAWEPGKYDAKVIVKFKNNSWQWDTNADNIESVTVDLQPQGDPDPFYPIYNVAFDGTVGVGTDNGRQGYGAGFIQKTEDLFEIAKDGATDVIAQPSASSNAVTNVSVSVIKGPSAFFLLNSTPTRGNVLSIARTGDDVDFTITPSVAVPLILNVTRNTSTDAYAFYSAEVNGQPQDLGTSFISWTGIGQGCVDFSGVPMTSYFRTPDAKAGSQFTGFEGYGLSWPLAKLAGTSSFYGGFFAPQDSLTLLKVTGGRDSASFESTFGNGPQVQIDTTGESVKSLKDVLDLVQQEKVCVIGGDYYWNNNTLRDELKASIDAKENTCIASR